MNNTYSILEEKILKEISNFCENDCGLRNFCSEDNCILFRIEDIIINA